jgi:hypothetical protein
MGTEMKVALLLAVVAFVAVLIFGLIFGRRNRDD